MWTFPSVYFTFVQHPLECSMSCCTYQRDKRMSAMWNEKEYMRRKQIREGLSFSLNMINYNLRTLVA